MHDRAAVIQESADWMAHQTAKTRFVLRARETISLDPVDQIGVSIHTTILAH
jgi:hypothetical protein